MKGKFYFVGTPIGNLKDFSINQIETLKNVDLILCEDTRTSKVLLDKFEIKKPLLSFHKFNAKEMTPKVTEKLLSGQFIALISDAGMPVISDPGAELIEEFKKNDITYSVVGGVSAFLNAFVLSGFSYPFSFIGFLPNKKSEQESLLLEFRNVKSTLIFYSSVHDIEKDIKTLFDFLGDRKICVCRELTKLHEEIVFSTLAEGFNGTMKGEFVIVVEGYVENQDEFSLEEKLQFYLSLGYNKNEAIKLVAKDKHMTKSEVYNYFVKKDK
ncbi:MAG: 16S rRNA (cytidine(1402)-2'-O)-methyltransferase [Christensenellales bacterium]